MKIWEAEERRGWEAKRTENILTQKKKKKITEICGKRTQWNRFTCRSNNIKERPDVIKEMWMLM